MPRDGSNIYHYPVGIEGEPNQTIQSAPYNSFLSDVEQDLNVPRPILAGGTGATSADAALIALGAEKSKQGPVTNYDTFPWVNGSFSSDAGATGAPTPSYPYIGIYYEHINPQYATIEARSVGEGSTGQLFIRQKTAGVWGTWSNNNAEMDTKKVNRAGDTMTGSLTISGGDITSIRASATTQGAYFFGNTGTKNLFYNGSSFSLNGGSLTLTDTLNLSMPSFAIGLYLRDTTAGLAKGLRCDPDGSLAVINNAITAEILKLSDAGVLTTNIVRAVTAFEFSASIPFATNAGAYSAIYNPSGGGAILLGDGSVGNVNYYRSPTHACQNAAGSENYWLASGDGNTRNTMFGMGTAPPVNAEIKVGYIGGGSTYGMALRPANDTATVLGFFNVAGTQIGSITQNTTNVSFNTSSDVRLKDNFTSFDAGGIIDQIAVYGFTWKSSGEGAYGVVAQQVGPVYPEAVCHDKENDWWGVDYSKFVPLLLQEIKALRARVAALEGV